MRSLAQSKRLLLAVTVLVLALVAAQCGGVATEEPAPQQADTQEETQPVEQEPAAETEPEAEAAAAETDDDDQKIVKEVVEESQAAQATQFEGGITVESDEDVSTLRSNRGGEYRDISSSDAVSFHVYQTTDTGSSGYQSLVYTGGLHRLDENTLEYIPNMAESYSISEDGLTFLFNLRQDMKWSDGTPLTAHDFKWTYDQVMKPENGYPYLSQFDFVTSYEALDDYTLEIKIDEVYAPALGQIDFITPLPKHVWEQYPWNDPEDNPEINSPSVVSGPYKLAEWKRDQFAIFEANENYWYHGAPNFNRYSIEIVPDNDIGYQKMKAGETDTGPITPENLEEARQLDNVTVYEWWPAAARWAYVGLNMREGYPTHDINVRHGLNYALDKELLTDEVMLGQAKRLCSAYPETSWVYNPDVPCYAYDPDKAQEAFAEAGYTLEGDKLVDENGEQLKLTLLYGPNTSQTLELMAVTIQDYLADIGIELEIQALEWASFLETKNTGEWDMYLGLWRATIEPHAMFLIWSEEGIPDLNSIAYVNEEVEGLFEEAGKTYDTEVRKEKYQEVQRILAEEAPYIFLFYQKSWSGQSNRIQGIEPTTLGIGWNQEDWYVQEPLE